MKPVFDFLISFAAAFFFAFLLHSPRRSLLLSAVMGGAGYLLYTVCAENIAPLAGYFIGTLAICAASETAARVMRMPAPIFITPAVIPLVPGVGLYTSVRLLVAGDTIEGLSKGIETLSYAGAMAAAIAVMPISIKIFKRTGKGSRK